MGKVQPHFGVWDYVVVAIVLLISSAIGIYYRFTGGKQKTLKEYLHADKNMSMVPVAFSVMASFMSAIAILGGSGESYTYGIHYAVINITYGIFTPIAVYVYMPVFFRLQATSVYEYLEKRFGKVARLSASLAYVIQMNLYMGIALYAPSLALEALTGISRTAAILSVGLVCTFYCTLGGMKAVLMTDVFQSLLMFVTSFSVIIHGLIDKGGFKPIWDIAEEGNRTYITNFDPDPTIRHTWFTLILGGSVTYLSLYAVNQTQVQRYLTVKDLKTAQKALWWNWPILTLLSLSCFFAGLSIYSRYYKCDPKSAGYITSTDQLMPYYVVETMGDTPGLAGLFVAGIFCASLSTLSAADNSLAAVTMEDYVKPLYKKLRGTPLSDEKATMGAKLLALFYGFVFIGIAFLAQFMGTLLQAALTVTNIVGGPLLALFSLGMFTTITNQKGAVTGLFVGMAAAGWMAYGQPRPSPQPLPVSTEGCVNFTLSTKDVLHSKDYLSRSSDNSEYFWLYRVSYMYIGLFGLLWSAVVALVTSWITRIITKEEVGPMDPNLFIPVVARRMEKIWNKSVHSRETLKIEKRS